MSRGRAKIDRVSILQMRNSSRAVNSPKKNRSSDFFVIFLPDASKIEKWNFIRRFYILYRAEARFSNSLRKNAGNLWKNAITANISRGFSGRIVVSILTSRRYDGGKKKFNFTKFRIDKARNFRDDEELIRRIQS